jgi:hypothetical protein
MWNDPAVFPARAGMASGGWRRDRPGVQLVEDLAAVVVRRGGCFRWVLLLAAVAFILRPSAVPSAVAAAASAQGTGAASSAFRGYERAERYPFALHARAESLAAVQRREALFGVRAPDPLEASLPFNLPESGPAARPSLIPGAIQRESVTPPSLPAWNVNPRRFSDTRPATPAPDAGFDTSAYTGFIPPDDAVAAGPGHLVSAVNRHLSISTLAGVHVATVAFSSFFPEEPTGGIFDPRVCFDAATGHFILTGLGRRTTAPPASTCVLAVSATADPTGVWYKYVFDVGRGGTPPTDWGDYTCLGYDGAAIYVAFNMYTFAQGVLTGNRLLIVNKQQAANGSLSSSGVMQLDNLMLPAPFVPNSLAFTLRPVEAGAPGSPGLIVSRAGQAGLALYKLNDPLAQQGAPSITSSFIDTTDFANQGSASQSGSAIPLDAGDTRLQKTVFANGLIWTCQGNSSTRITGGKSQVVFYKINPSGAGTLVDVDTIVDNNLSFFYPAIQPDASGNAIAVFAASGSTTFASVYHARYDGATGSFQPPVLTGASLGPYVRLDGGGTNRWGDYSDAALDVLSGTSVWIQGELAASIDLWKMIAAQVASSPPTVPSGLTASVGSSTQINLAWTDNSVGEYGFRIERRTGSEAFALLTALGPNSVRYADSGLIPSTAYFYRVRAFNAVGDSAPSNEASATTLSRPPAAPTVLIATPVSSTRILLAWMDNSDNETAFEVERKSGGAFALVAVVSANATSFADSGLSPGMAYSYRVRAIHSEGVSAYSNEANAATPSTAFTLVISPISVVGGTAATATVTLDDPAPEGGVTLSLSSDNATAAVPSTLTVPAGMRIQPFLVTTAAVANATNATITATMGSVSVSAALAVRPISVALLAVGPNPVTGGSLVTGIVVLDAPAAPAVITVTLATSDPTVAALPTASLIFAAGITSQLFTVTTAPVSETRVIAVTATANGASKTASLAVTP